MTTPPSGPPGRRVLVTGAPRGIGRAVAVAFAAAGDRVAVHYAAARDDADATRRKLAGSGHVLVAGELTDPDAAREVVEAAVRELGGVDVLVNTAAVAPGPGNRHPVATTSYEDWQRA